MSKIGFFCAVAALFISTLAMGQTAENIGSKTLYAKGSMFVKSDSCTKRHIQLIPEPSGGITLVIKPQTEVWVYTPIDHVYTLSAILDDRHKAVRLIQPCALMCFDLKVYTNETPDYDPNIVWEVIIKN